jgi:hypothetical protein
MKTPDRQALKTNRLPGHTLHRCSINMYFPNPKNQFFTRWLINHSQPMIAVASRNPGSLTPKNQFFTRWLINHSQPMIAVAPRNPGSLTPKINFLPGG